MACRKQVCVALVAGASSLLFIRCKTNNSKPNYLARAEADVKLSKRIKSSDSSNVIDRGPVKLITFHPSAPVLRQSGGGGTFVVTPTSKPPKTKRPPKTITGHQPLVPISPVRPSSTSSASSPTPVVACT